MEIHKQFLIFSIALVVLPSLIFIMNSRGIGWDTIGHAAEAYVYKKEILPNIYGWNSHFFFGYPIHLYPPLSRLALAALMHVLDWAEAVKLLLVLSCIFIIPAAYLFLRSLGYDEKKAAFACIFIAFFMINFDKYSAGNITLANAYYTGLVANFFALPFLFLSLAYFNKNMKLSALFASAVILSNLIAAIILAICLAVLVLIRIFEKKDANMKEFALFATIVLLLSAFWLVPYAKRHLDKKMGIGPIISFDYILLLPPIFGVFAGSFLFYLVFIRKLPVSSWLAIFSVAIVLLFLRAELYAASSVRIMQQANLNSTLLRVLPFALLFSLSAAYLLFKKDAALVKFYLLFMLAIFSFYLVAALKNAANLTIPALDVLIFHFYRVGSFAVFLEAATIGTAAASLVFRIRKRLAFFSKRKLVLAASLFFLLAVLLLFPVNVFQPQNEDSLVYDFSNATSTGRAILYDGKSTSNPHGAYFQFYLQTGKPISMGLFAEEAELSAVGMSYAASLISSDMFVWGASLLPRMPLFEENYSNASYFYSDLLWVTDIFAVPEAYQGILGEFEFNNINSSFKDLGFLRVGNTTFRHYYIGNFSLAEIRNAKPACVSDWKSFMYSWFEEGDTSIYYESCNAVNYSLEEAKKAKVQVLNYSNGKMELLVNSSLPVPVFIKEAYDPDWKAYLGEKRLEVYRATPAFMLIFGSGKIELKYEPEQNPILFALFIAGLFAVFWKKI